MMAAFFMKQRHSTRGLQKQKGEQVKLVEEKGKKSEGIWDLDPGATEKAEHGFSGQP